MNYLHLKRGSSWTKELLTTLISFWSKHPNETPAVIRFFLKKTFAFPRFLNKNVLLEKQSGSYLDLLNETKKLYKKYGPEFKPTDLRSYKKLDGILINKSQMLYFLVRKTAPDIVVETGVAAGESTGMILQAIKDNKKGRLYSIDLPFQWYVYGNHELHLDSLPAGQLSGYLVPESLKKNWELILGDTYEKLPKLMTQLKKLDIFLHDSEHTDKTMTFEYKATWPYLAKKGWLLSDDIDFTQAFQKFAKKNQTKVINFKQLGISQKP